MWIYWDITYRIYIKNTETLIDASKEVGLEVNVEETKYMLVSRDQDAEQNGGIKIGNRWFENAPQFKYLGTTVTNQNSIQEEIKRWLNSGNACYHSVQNLVSFRPLSKNLKVRIYKAITLSVVLNGCETWYYGRNIKLRCWEQGAEENIWTEEEWSVERMEKTA
jgi:hypothetical protein